MEQAGVCWKKKASETTMVIILLSKTTMRYFCGQICWFVLVPSNWSFTNIANTVCLCEIIAFVEIMDVSTLSMHILFTETFVDRISPSSGGLNGGFAVVVDGSGGYSYVDMS